jgi:TonB-dependent starch-binding outer membrane protein SusC
MMFIFRKVGKRVLLLLTIFLSVTAFSQKTITGKVTDGTNVLSGATVQVKGTKITTATKDDGTFSFTVPNGATTLVFSSVGHSKKELAIGDKTSFEVSLTVTSTQQAEVVVIGYGNQKRKEVTGTISKIDGSKIASVAAPSFESALAGKAAGVNINTSGGTAGAGAVIRIRGIATLTQGGDPLIVIDGLPVENNYVDGPTRNQLGQDRNPLGNIDPNEIESVEVLKDASASGIYGSRGANGVILITTKRGKGSKLKVNLNARYGISTYSVKPKYVDKNTWLAIRQEAWELDGNTGLQQNLPGAVGGFNLNTALNNPSTDWWDLATRAGGNRIINLSVNQATKYVNYFVGGSVSNENSYIEGNDYKRYSIRGNADIKPIKNLNIQVSGSFNNGVSNLLNNAWNGGLGLAMSTGLPYYPVFNPDGSYFRSAGAGLTWDFGGGNNFQAQKDLSDYRSIEKRSLIGVNAIYTPIKNLNVKVYYNKNMSNSSFNGYKAFSLNNAGASSKDSGDVYSNINKYVSDNNGITADYKFILNKKATLTALIGAEQTEDVTNFQNVGVISNKPLYDGGKNDAYKNLESTTPYEVGYNKTRQSIFSRVNFNYDGKYFVQGSLRRDGSSVFVNKTNKWGYFPTVSGGWILSEEAFLKENKIINFLKLRLGWGLVGNDNVDWRAGYPSADTSRSFGGGGYGGQPTTDGRTNLGNPDLKWETTNEITAAVEYGFLNNKISGEIALYKRKTKFNNLLTNLPIDLSSGISGNSSQIINVGDLYNQGIEFSLNTQNVKSNDFSWNTNFNIAYNYNQVTGIGDVRPDAISGGTNETRVLPGYAIGTIFTVRYFGVDPADGLPIFLDKNGNQTKTLNVASVNGDKVPVANVYPTITGGITNSFKYKAFDLSTLFTYQLGGHIWDNSGKRSMGFMTDWNVYSQYVGNYWRKPGDVAKYPRPTIKGYPGVEGNPWSNNSSIQVYKSDFIRLRELSVGYNIPAKSIKRLRMSNARVYLSAYNLLLFTKYPVGDPETGRDGEGNDARNQSANSNFLNPPLSKSFNFGFNITF